MIRPMRNDDIPAVTDLYMSHMFDSTLSKFRKNFVHLVFEGLLESIHGINLVYESDNNIVGFISATSNAQGLFKQIRKTKSKAMLKEIIRPIAQIPFLFIILFETLSYFKKTNHQDIKAELLFIAILPAYRQRGIAQALITAVFEELRNRKISIVKVNVVKQNSAVNSLLIKMGFQDIKGFRFFGKNNILYKYEF